MPAYHAFRFITGYPLSIRNGTPIFLIIPEKIELEIQLAAAAADMKFTWKFPSENNCLFSV